MIKQLLKKVLIIYLVVIACVFTPTYRAYAASPGGWSFSKYDIAQTIVTAFKNGAPAAMRYTPNVASVAKFLVRGAGAGALAYVIAKYGSDAYDWAYDELTQSVVGTPKANSARFNDPISGAVASYTGEQACAMLTAHFADQPSIGVLTYDGTRYCLKSDGTRFGTLDGGVPQKRTISVDELASTALSDAKKGIAPAKVAIENSVADDINVGSLDAALDAAKADADASHACGTGTHWSGSACVADTPSTPTTPTTPDTPFDPSSIIDAINSVFNAVSNLFDAVMSIPDVINAAIDDLLNDIKDFFQPAIDLVTDFFQWVKDTAIAWKDDFVDEYKAFRDWVKAEPTPENPTQPDLTTLPTPPTDSVNISFDGGCPAPKVVPWYLGGHNVDVTIPYTPICDTATLLNPLIKLAASLGAVFIIAGIRRGDDG